MTWTASAPVPEPLTTPAVCGYSGKLYAWGQNAASTAVKGYVYDPSANSWTAVANCPLSGSGIANWLGGYLMPIGSDLYLITALGGASLNGATLLKYDPAADTWTDLTTTSGMDATRISTGADVVGTTVAWVSMPGSGGQPAVTLYDPSTNTWGTIGSDCPSGDLDTGVSCAVAAISGLVYILHGVTSTFTVDGALVSYDPTSDTWTSLTADPSPVTNLTNPTAGMSRVAAIGGQDATGNPVDTVELYDPTAGTWSSYASLVTARSNSGAAVVGTKVYVVGGYGATSTLASVETAPSDWSTGPSTLDLAGTGIDDEQGNASETPIRNLFGSASDDEQGSAGATTTGTTDLAAAGGVDGQGGATLDLILPPPTVPAGMTGTIWQRRSYTYTPPSVDTATGRMVKQQRTLYVAEPWGYTQIVIDGLDRTWHRGERTKLGPMVWAVPGGPATLTMIFPVARPFEDLAAALAIPRVDGAFIGVYKRHADHSRADDWAWEGLVHAKRPVISGDDWHWEVDIKGFLHQPEDGVNQPPFQIYSAAAQDVGSRVPEVLNSWTGRRYHAIPPVVVGTPTLARGSFGQSRLQMVQDLVAFAWTSDGRQWRVNDVQGPGRRFVLELPSTAVDYHVSVGGDGVDLSSLVDEGDEAPTVIFGEWVDADGNRSQNVKYPHAHEDTAPPFPLTDPAVFNPGDGHTGFAPFSSWLRAHGAGVIHSGDTYDARDEDDVVAAQKRMGVTPDGVVGRQTWGTAFNTGANVGDLGAVFYAPLAADPRTQPRLYNSDGQDLGPNPAYDPTFPCREVKIDFGSGVTRNEVLQAARAMLARNTTGRNFAGEIRLTGDPEECSRWDMRHGRVISVRYLDNSGSTGVAMHIAQVSWDDPEADDSPVTLTVDTRYRDAPTLTQILQNRREAKSDPARILRRQETGKLTQSTRTPFDKDNAAGRIFTHAIQSGFWRIVQFPASAYGEFVDLVATTSPARAFVLGLFVKPVTANFLAHTVGNPLDPANTRPFDVNRSDLRAAGLIQGWGSGVQPGGYSDGYTGAATAGDPLTGKIEDDGSTKYASFNPPWLWLAEYCGGGNTNIAVTFLNAPEQV